MRTWLGDRHNQIKLLFFVLMILLGARLFYLTVVQGQVWAERAENLSTKTVYTSAPRGEIRDRYGRLLAGNEVSYTVNLVAAEIDEKQINTVALNLLNLPVSYTHLDVYKRQVIAYVAAEFLIFHMIDDIYDAVEERDVMGNQDKRILIFVQITSEPFDVDVYKRQPMKSSAAKRAR